MNESHGMEFSSKPMFFLDFWLLFLFSSFFFLFLCHNNISRVNNFPWWWLLGCDSYETFMDLLHRQYNVAGRSSRSVTMYNISFS